MRRRNPPREEADAERRLLAEGQLELGAAPTGGLIHQPRALKVLEALSGERELELRTIERETGVSRTSVVEVLRDLTGRRPALATFSGTDARTRAKRYRGTVAGDQALALIRRRAAVGGAVEDPAEAEPRWVERAGPLPPRGPLGQTYGDPPPAPPTGPAPALAGRRIEVREDAFGPHLKLEAQDLTHQDPFGGPPAVVGQLYLRRGGDHRTFGSHAPGSYAVATNLWIAPGDEGGPAIARLLHERAARIAADRWQAPLASGLELTAPHEAWWTVQGARGKAELAAHRAPGGFVATRWCLGYPPGPLANPPLPPWIVIEHRLWGRHGLDLNAYDVREGQRRIGELRVDLSRSDETWGRPPVHTGYVSWVQVDEPYRRHGVARAMYLRAAQVLAELGLHLASGSTINQEPAARAFWNRQVDAGLARKVSKIRTAGGRQYQRFVLRSAPPERLANPDEGWRGDERIAAGGDPVAWDRHVAGRLRQGLGPLVVRVKLGGRAARLMADEVILPDADVYLVAADRGVAVYSQHHPQVWSGGPPAYDSYSMASARRTSKGWAADQTLATSREEAGIRRSAIGLATDTLKERLGVGEPGPERPWSGPGSDPFGANPPRPPASCRDAALGAVDKDVRYLADRGAPNARDSAALAQLGGHGSECHDEALAGYALGLRRAVLSLDAALPPPRRTRWTPTAAQVVAPFDPKAAMTIGPIDAAKRWVEESRTKLMAALAEGWPLERARQYAGLAESDVAELARKGDRHVRRAIKRARPT